MEVRTTVDEDGHTNKHYIFEPGEVAVKTGPITGIKTLADGTTFDVNEEYVLVDNQEQADELADLVGKHYAETGHPHDVELDEETGKPVQRPFVYLTPEEQAALDAPAKNKKGA